MMLMVVLGLPLFASVMGSAQAEARLPLCCRRGGVHRCMEMGMDADAGRPMMRMACSAYPQSLGQVHTGGWLFEVASSAATRMPLSVARVGQVEAGYRISSGRAWQKRGPPVDLIRS